MIHISLFKLYTQMEWQISYRWSMWELVVVALYAKIMHVTPAICIVGKTYLANCLVDRQYCWFAPLIKCRLKQKTDLTWLSVCAWPCVGLKGFCINSIVFTWQPVWCFQLIGFSYMCPVRHAAIRIRLDHLPLAGFDWWFGILYWINIVLNSYMVTCWVSYPAIGIICKSFDGNYAHYTARLLSLLLGSMAQFFKQEAADDLGLY